MAFPVDSERMPRDVSPRHVSPSRIRYEKEHPMVSVRLTESMRKTLDAARKDSALSYADLIKTGLKAAADDKTAYQRGWDDAEETYAIEIPCSVCGKPIIMTPGSGMHKAAIDLLRAEKWSHGECLKKSD